MTPQEYSILNEIIYSDFAFDGSCDTSLNLQEMCRQAVVNPPEGLKEDVVKSMQAVANGDFPGLSNLTLKGAINNNDSTGLVAYAFQDGDTVICAYRGTEFINANDVADDAAAAIFGNSEQYEEALQFAKEMGEGCNLEVTGHSMGGNIAMYVASRIDTNGGYAFNSQGFPQDYLTPEEISRLRDCGLINYVTDNDKVGSIGFHPENRQFVDGENEDTIDIAFAGHGLLNITFDENGYPIPSEQSDFTKGVEKTTQWIFNLIREKFPDVTYSVSNRITVPLDEMSATVGRYEEARNGLQDAYINVRNALNALDGAWQGNAYKAMKFQWDQINRNIEEADDRMLDAIDELKKTHQIFTNTEKAVGSTMAALDKGTSPFD